MFNCMKLNKENIPYLRKLNSSRSAFNPINEDFFIYYDNTNFAQRFILRRRVELLRQNSNYIGYMWSKMESINECTIKSMSILKINDMEKGLNFLINTIKSKCKVKYMCEKNDFNFSLLEMVGFIKKEGTIQLELENLSNVNCELLWENEVKYNPFRKGIDEIERCKLQNDIFRSKTRMPLKIEDIFYDEARSYYFNEGAIFVCKDGKNIGYGQVIIENNIPFIVNFGIIKEYRGMGYGKKLLLYLLNIVKKYNYNNTIIKVDYDNTVALNLYKSIGFKKQSETYEWEIIK